MSLIKTYRYEDIQPLLGDVNTKQRCSNTYATNGGDIFSCNLPTSQRPDEDVDDMMSKLSHGSDNAPLSEKTNNGNISNEECIVENQVSRPSVTLQRRDDLKHDSTEQNEYFLLVNTDIDQVDEEGCTLLYKAALKGQLSKVKNLVLKGADPNKGNEYERKALHVAAEEGHAAIVEFLLDQGPDMNAEDDLGQTPLHAAIHNNQCSTAFVLSSNGSDVNKRDYCGRTTLHIAAETGNIQIFENLVDKTCDINVEDDMGLTVLHHAVRNGHSNIVDHLLKKGADETPYRGDSLIFASASFGNLDLVKLFISRGGDVNEENSIGQNPLHVAASKGYLDITKCLVQEGCDMNKDDHDNFTPVHGAVLNGHLDVLEYLITQQAKITKYDGKSVLHLAAINGHLDILQYFIKMGADVSELDDIGQTPLHVSAGVGNFDVVKYLIEQGSKTDKQDHHGYTPLHIAAAKGQLEIVKYLADQNCYVKGFDNEGLTPLTLSAKHGHLDIVKYLADGKADETNSLFEATLSGHLDIVNFFMNRIDPRLAAFHGDLDTVKYLVQQGVDVNSCDAEGWTPLEYAVKNDNYTVIDYLLTNGAKANQGMEESPLCMASRLGHLDAVNVLISRGASVNAESHRGQIPIHAAAANGRIQVVETLIQNGSDLNKTDIDGWTPLLVAVQNGQLEVVKYLKRKGAIDIKNRGMTSLYTAAQHGHLDIVDLFLSNGADLNEEDGCIALHAAAANGSLEIVQKLINHGSNVNKMAENGWTPLHAAVHSGRLDIVRYLISYGAMKTRFKGMTVLYIAAQRGHTDLLEYFVTTGCDVNDGTKTPLLAACYNGHIDSVKMLVTQGACINHSDRNKWTPVHAAAQKGHWQVAIYLVENGADTNAKDIDGMTPIQAADDGGPGIFITSIRWYLKRLRAEMHDERHNDPCKNFRSDGNCTEVFGGSGMFKEPVCDRLSGINGESYYPMPLNVTTASIPVQGPWRNNPDTVLRHIKTATRPKRVSCVSKAKTQLHQVNGGEVSATNDLLITDEDDAVDPKAGTKSERRNKENCFSIPALLHRAILALVFYFSCFPILVAGNLRLTEPVTLEVGTRGVVPFYIERPSSTLQFSLFYTIQFGSKGRAFCINGKYDVNGFKDPSQISRFTTTVSDRDTSPCVNMTIDNVNTIDGGQYTLEAVWHSSEEVLHDTQKKQVIVQRPPGPADCFVTLSDHGESEFPYEVHCWAKTGSMPTILTCYQNDKDLVILHNITHNWHTTNAIFFVSDTTRFSCCSHDITSTVGVATCNDFEWPPGYSGIPSAEKTTSRSRSANKPTDPTPVNKGKSYVGSGACRPFMIIYLFLYLVAFLILC